MKIQSNISSQSIPNKHDNAKDNYLRFNRLSQFGLISDSDLI